MARRAVAEALGTAFLLAAVVGSGIMGERLAGGNVAIALLANSIATAAMLVALILTFGAVSGAHFNPAVTLADASQGGLAWREVPMYLAAQIVGAFAGVGAAHLMFQPAPVLRVATRPLRKRPALQRIHCNLRLALGHLGLRPTPLRCRSFRRRSLHHRRLLVYRVHFICQSGGDASPRRLGHLRGHSSGRCSRIHRCAARRRSRGHRAFSLACPAVAYRRRPSRCPSP